MSGEHCMKFNRFTSHISYSLWTKKHNYKLITNGFIIHISLAPAFPCWCKTSSFLLSPLPIISKSSWIVFYMYSRAIFVCGHTDVPCWDFCCLRTLLALIAESVPLSQVTITFYWPFSWSPVCFSRNQNASMFAGDSNTAKLYHISCRSRNKAQSLISIFFDVMKILVHSYSWLWYFPREVHKTALAYGSLR